MILIKQCNCDEAYVKRVSSVAMKNYVLRGHSHEVNGDVLHERQQ